MSRTTLPTLVLVILIVGSLPSFADSGCFKQRFIELYADKYGFDKNIVKQSVNSTGMAEILIQIYESYVDKLMKADSAYNAFESFSVNWNIASHHDGINDYELVPPALRECVKWMWGE